MVLQINSIESLLQGIGIQALPGEKLTVMAGDTVRVRATIDYRGPAISDSFYGAIGKRGLISFDEIIYGSNPVSFPQSFDWVRYELTVDIPVTTAISPGTNYDLYVKLYQHEEAGYPEVDDVIDVMGIAEFQNFAITSYERL